MNKMTRMQMLAAVAAFAVASLGIAKADHGGDNKGGNGNNAQVRMRTGLSGAAIQAQTPSGSADFRSESARNRSRLNVEVEHVNLTAGTMLDVTVQHGTATMTVGQIKLSAGGFGELELNTQDGDKVPAIEKGDIVTVSNAGAAILAGAF